MSCELLWIVVDFCNGLLGLLVVMISKDLCDRDFQSVGRRFESYREYQKQQRVSSPRAGIRKEWRPMASAVPQVHRSCYLFGVSCFLNRNTFIFLGLASWPPA
jgi:hypothetical protein